MMEHFQAPIALHFQKPLLGLFCQSLGIVASKTSQEELLMFELCSTSCFACLEEMMQKTVHVCLFASLQQMAVSGPL